MFGFFNCSRGFSLTEIMSGGSERPPRLVDEREAAKPLRLDALQREDDGIVSGVSWERAQETLDSLRMEKVDMMNVISC